MGINMYYLSSGFINLLIHRGLRLPVIVVCGILGFSAMVVYLVAIAYLVFRKNKEASLLIALTASERNSEANIVPREDIASMQLPQLHPQVDVD